MFVIIPMASRNLENSQLPKSIAQAVEAIGLSTLPQFLSCFSIKANIIDETKDQYPAPSLEQWFEMIAGYNSIAIDILDSSPWSSPIWIHVAIRDSSEANVPRLELSPYLYFQLDENDQIMSLRVSTRSPTEPTMRAAWAAFGDVDDPMVPLRCDLWNIPKPPNGWVTVKVAAAALNYHDIFTLRGLGMFELRFPLILGNEGVGTLEDGTSVVIFPVMRNPEFEGDCTLDPDRHVLGERTQGSMAEYVIVPEHNLVRKPKNMSVKTASVMGIAWLTAYRMLFTHSRIQAGQTMLVQGSTGGVATALIQLGRAAGMTVWATGRTEEKRTFALETGAHRVFPPGHELPAKVSAVFDMSGEQTLPHSVDCLAPGGRVVCCGMHSGRPYANIDLMKLITRGISIVGTYAGNREEFEALLAYVDEKGIVPYVHSTLPLERVSEGLRMLIDGKVRSKIVITM